MENIIGQLTGLAAVTFIFAGAPAAIVLVYYFSRKAKHAERLAMIEKGVEPSAFMHDDAPYNYALMWGMLILGVGLGLFFGYILSVATSMGEGFLMPSLALVFGGLGLIGFFVYRKKTGFKTAG